MNEIEICLQNKIDIANGVLQPSILQAILNLYHRGYSQLTTRMLQNECFEINQNVPWNKRIPAICNAMRNTIECGSIIVGENKNNIGFTIAFIRDNNPIVIKTQKKVEKKVEKSKATSEANQSNQDLNINQEKISLSKNFKIVMMCAGAKQPNSGLIFNEQNIKFRAVSSRNNNEYLPDDLINGIENIRWRDYVINNQNPETIPFRAYELYRRNEYTCLYNNFEHNLYILSAGWGLVRADYRLPNYDITFSNVAPVSLNTRRNDNVNVIPIYDDFNQLEVNPEDDIIFVGGKKYINLFYELTQNLTNRKIIYYNSQNQPNPQLGNYVYRRYFINYFTNWHYELAHDLCQGLIP